MGRLTDIKSVDGKQGSIEEKMDRKDKIIVVSKCCEK